VKKILLLISNHVRQDFQLKYYASIIFILVASLMINYTIDLENAWIDQHPVKYLQILFYIILYASGYYITCLIVFHFNGVKNLWSSGKFWLFSLFGLLILSLDKGFPFLTEILNAFYQPYEIYSWLFRIVANITSFILIFIPLILFHQFIDRQKSNLYGLTAPGDVRPYLYLLLLVAPIMFLASIQKDFTNYYPAYKANTVAEIWNWPDYLPMVVFEFFYGARFLNIELLLRGFFVIGMAQILGRHAVIPMVVIYCFLHFGKPAGEAISSIFGGYVLGIIALNTRSIWGGIIIHVGVAWLMEVCAYISRQL